MYKIKFFLQWACLMFIAVISFNSCSDNDAIIFGCTDPSASNYDQMATDDDGSCLFEQKVFGCTDSLAVNYDPLATEDNSKECIWWTLPLNTFQLDEPA